MTEPRARRRRAERQRLDEMFGAAYRSLRRSAARCMRGEGPRTLQPTALVNEAYLRIAAQVDFEWRDRSTFFALAARVMRQVLVDEARRRRAAKRSSSRHRTTLVDLMLPELPDPPDVIDVDDALTRLEALDRRKASIVQMRFFAGMTIEETSEILGLSTATVNREWRAARAWLGRELGA